MSDEADKGNDTAELFLDVALKNQKAAPRLPKLTGRCLNCREQVDPWSHFCDVDCGADWEKRQSRATVNRPVIDDEA
jgi:hypothetical protein